MPRLTRVLAWALALTACASLWTLARRLSDSPLTLAITLPDGVHVHIDGARAPSAHAQHPHDPAPQGSPAAAALPPLREPYQSILTTITALEHYGEHTTSVLARKHARFARLPAAHAPYAAAIDYAGQFTRADALVPVNAAVLSAIAGTARAAYGFEADEVTVRVRNEIVGDLVGHLVRDWSAEGREERERVIRPIVDALRSALPKNSQDQFRILVPGAGLGRLAHEIALEPDFHVDASELDYGSVLAYRYLANTTHTPAPLSHTFHPFLTDWSFQSNAADRFLPVRFPDALPNPTPADPPRVRMIDGDFLELAKAVQRDREHGEDTRYDAVATLFFIDVAENEVEFLQAIHSVLKPGGLWVNLGPFKWGTHSQLQLSAEEVLHLADIVGFAVDPASRRAIDAVYAHQPGSLLKFTYVTQFWTARKRD